MALAVIFVMVGWAYGSVTEMDGGTHSGTNDGAATYGSVSSFYDDTGFIEADILAMASTNGIGTAWVQTSVPTLETSTLTDDNYELTVGAEGTVEASVTGNSADAFVTSASLIRSYAQAYDEGVYGSAEISSSIGNEWLYDTEYQDGYVYGVAEGQFEASSNADGSATYSGSVISANNEEVSYTVAGSAEGTTTIEGAVTDDVGTIGSELYDTYTPYNPATAYIYSQSSAFGDGYYMDSYARTENEVLVAAGNNPCLTGAVGSYVAGTVSGVNSATGTAQWCMEGKCDQYISEASQESSQSADVNVVNDADSAAAHSYVESSAESNYAGSFAYSDVGVGASATRRNAGSDANGDDRVWGEAFVGAATWDAQASHTYYSDSYQYDLTQATVSGDLGTITDPTTVSGIGAGTFLQNKKNGESYAIIDIDQDAYSYMGGDADTYNDIYVDILGPKASSLGSSTWDGSGVYGAIDDLYVAAQADEVNGNLYTTDVTGTTAYLYVDGTNDLMYNGPGLVEGTVTFDAPSTATQLAGIVFPVTSPSPTQRETWGYVQTYQYN